MRSKHKLLLGKSFFSFGVFNSRTTRLILF